MKYQPNTTVKKVMKKAKESISVIFIQLKLYPNRLFDYTLSSFVVHPKDPSKKLPFIVDYLPHLRVDDIHDGNALEKVIQR